MDSNARGFLPAANRARRQVALVSIALLLTLLAPHAVAAQAPTIQRLDLRSTLVGPCAFPLGVRVTGLQVSREPGRNVIYWDLAANQRITYTNLVTGTSLTIARSDLTTNRVMGNTLIIETSGRHALIVTPGEGARTAFIGRLVLTIATDPVTGAVTQTVVRHGVSDPLINDELCDLLA